MYIQPIHPAQSDPVLSRLFKQAARELLHAPVKLRMALSPDYPWLVSGAVSRIEAFLRPEHRVFEWGGGRSTVFFARRAASVVTVEHARKWHRRLAARIEELDLRNVTLRFIEPREPARGDPPAPSPARPARWNDPEAREDKPEFRAYADAVLDYPDGRFDLVLVDGRARVACARNALDKLAPGGLLVLDNAEWPKYQPIRDMTRGWNAESFANGVWETAIFTRPGDATASQEHA